MAVGIQNYPNIDTSDPGNYPNGNILDDPAGLIGTPINVETTADIHQTFDRALSQTGITPNGNPDNVTNGYQYSLALGLESWQVSTTPSLTPLGGGSLTSVAFTFKNYRRVGKTVEFQAKFSLVVTGTVNTIYVALPFLSSSFVAGADMYLVGGLMGGIGFSSPEIIMCPLENPFGFGFAIKRMAGDFAASSLLFFINIKGEVA